MASTSLLYWPEVEEYDFRKALTCPRRDQLQVLGFKTWNDVAVIMNEQASVGSGVRKEYDAKSCEIHYRLYTMYALTDLPLSKFVLELPPWQRAEYDLLVRFLHHSMVGGTAADPQLTWEAIAENMQREEALIPYPGLRIDGFNWTRKYTKNRVFLAWNTLMHSNRRYLSADEKVRVDKCTAGAIKDIEANPEKWALT